MWEEKNQRIGQTAKAVTKLLFLYFHKREFGPSVRSKGQLKK